LLGLALHAKTPPAASPAAGNEPVTLESLLVTADLWASPLDRIPASVTVIDDETLRAGSVRHFGDLVDQIPNFTWTGGTSRPRYLQIRGIGENSQYEGETPDSAVRFLVDDFDFTGIGTLAGTFDTQQVEVLRGPQAGAFGANAAGGLVRLVSNAPTPTWSGRLEGTIGENNLRAAGLAIGGPLVGSNPEQLMFRLSVHQSEDDGFRRNVTVNRDTNARDEFNTRLRLTWNPGPDWRWEAGVLYSRLDSGFDDFALDNNGFLTFSDQPGRDEQEATATSLRGTYTGWQSVRLTSVTAASWVDSIYSYDDDWTAASYMGFSDLRRERTAFNQELRLDSTATRDALGAIDRWTLGAYFNRTDEDGLYSNEDPWTLRGLETRYRAKNTALFGQAGMDLGSRARTILGLRIENVDMTGMGTRTRTEKDPLTVLPPAALAPSFDDTVVGGKLTFEFDLGERTLAFASVTRGYKAGGINIDARIDPSTDPLVYETETLWNYEVGLRGHGLDQRLHGELTLFRLDRRDTQVRDSAGFGGSYRFFTDNANDAHVQGLEASGAWSATDHWSFHGSLALMDSELEAFAVSDGSLIPARRLANTPRYGYSLGARFRHEGGLFANVEMVGRARQYDSNNQNEARRPFTVFNATIGYVWRAWTFSVWGRNLFDKEYDQRVFFFGNEEPDYLPTRYESRAAPRQFGVSAAYGF
jgi:outer membrane receptor protein involved in Fe transport